MPIRVLIVDDSAYHRRTLSRIIASDPTLTVVGTAADGEDAIRKVVSLHPDVLTCDLEMPRMDGFTFLRWLMRTFPRPVLVVSSHESNKSVFQALDLGAADFVIKPVSVASDRLAEIGGELLLKIHQVAAARAETLAFRAERLARLPKVVSPIGPPVKAALSPAPGGRYRCVAIGASTGGPPAIEQILTTLPEDFPAPVLIAQHMPEGFTKLFAERLNRRVGLRVKEAEIGEIILPGLVLIAPGGRHLSVGCNSAGAPVAQIESPRPGDRFVPSVDRLLLSASEIYRDKLICVILTGMGDDGTVGIRAAGAQGGLTMAESEETSVIFGMPREAIRSGSIRKILPLPEIGGTLVQECTDALHYNCSGEDLA